MTVVQPPAMLVSALRALLCLVPAASTAAPTADLRGPPAALHRGQAVAIALERNRDLIAARLDVEAAEVDRAVAAIWPNPDLSYSLGNVVLPPANEQGVGLRPGPFDQTVHTFGVSEVIDVWFKRGLRRRVADRAAEQSRLLLEDAVREVAYTVSSAFEDLLREQSEHDLAVQTRERYDETVRLSRSRFQVGEISETELKKIELEGLKYRNDEISAALQLDQARTKLASLLALDSSSALPRAQSDGPPPRGDLSLAQLTDEALAERPDLRALRVAQDKADVALESARREALPDPSLGVSYTHDNFEVSGDNPHTMALSVSLPLPLFDRNQGAVGHAAIDVRRAENERAKLELEIRHQVAEAVARAESSRALLDVFEGGGMLQRAESALKVTEKSYKAGAVSLLELLEAERTYIETEGSYLRSLNDYRQALVDVDHAAGKRP